MTTVLSCLASTLLFIAAAARTSEGLTTYAETAQLLTDLNQAEYQLHQCGSLLAAKENVTLAARYLGSKEISAQRDWHDIAATVHDDLDATISTDCQENALHLHAESPDATPDGLPNVIYRLHWHDAEFPHG